MSEFVRVRLSNGHEVTLSKAYVDGLSDAAPQVVDAPATSLRGVPLPATRKGGRRLKPTTTVSKEAAKKAAKKSATPAPSDEPTTGGVAVKPEEASK